MRQTMWCVVVSAFVLTAACGGGGGGAGDGASIVLDHEHLGPQGNLLTSTPVGGVRDVAQTFTASHTGRLVGLEIFLDTVGAPAEPALTVELWPTDAAGVPVEDAGLRLAIATVPMPDVPSGAFLPIDFAAQAVPLVTGETYAVVAVRGLVDGSEALWLGHGVTDSPGELYERRDTRNDGRWQSIFGTPKPDLGLRVFVELAPPGD